MYLIVREDGRIEAIKDSISDEAVYTVVNGDPCKNSVCALADDYSDIVVVYDGWLNGEEHDVLGCDYYGDVIIARYGILDGEYHSLREDDVRWLLSKLH